jgi:transaldolase
MSQPAAAISAQLSDQIHAFVTAGIDLTQGRLTPTSSPFWAGLTRLGSELWLDTGDIDAATPLWTKEFTALTTNNTLLNKEVQKGIYDELIHQSAAILQGLDLQTKIIEIAFILNARHGLRLAQKFGGKVSVELHTDLAHDVERSVAYGKRYFAICPQHFIVKIPLTPSGLIATRELRKAGIPVNFTLGFSARHNHLAAAFASPSYVNVFLGRLNAYVSDNKLGDGKNVGEKAMLASQRAVTRVSGGATKHIAASLRGASQVADLAGIDVYTMPTTVAIAAVKELNGQWRSRLNENYPVSWGKGIDERQLRADTLWTISEADVLLAKKLNEQPPATGDALVDMARAAGLADLFPRLTDADRKRIDSDGKIPKHAGWATRISSGELAIDTLLNLAALGSFTADQAQLDERIRKYM